MFFIAETIPESLNLKPRIKHASIGESILDMVKNAKYSIDIGSIYSTLLNNGIPTPSDQIGKSIYNELVNAAKRGTKIRFLLTKPNEQFQEPEAEQLAKLFPKMITVGYLDLNKLTHHGGIQHMKCFIVDHESIYLGSANCDWRAYSEVAEVGIFGIKSGDAGQYMQILYNYLWHEIDSPSSRQNRISCDYESSHYKDLPMTVGHPPIQLSFSMSPPFFKKYGIESDLDAIRNVINNQNEGFIRLCAMEYSNFTYELHGHKFWGEVDWMIRKATMERDVTVHIMVDHHDIKSFLPRHSLQTLHGYGKICVKTIEFPKLQPDIPFTRLFHSKMCISEDRAWVSTNNLTPNYFENCSGIGCTLFGTTLAGNKMIIELKEIFDRYYDSEYAKYLELS